MKRPTLREMADALEQAATALAYYGPAPDHICGPEAGCDGACQEAHQMSRDLDEWRALIRRARDAVKP